MWYGLRLGLLYEEVRAFPLGELLDLISIEQIKREGYTRRVRETEDDFWALLEWR